MKSFADLMEAAKKCPPKKVAVAVAQDPEVIEAVKECKVNGIADAIMVGDAVKIKEIARQRNININNFEVVHEPETEAAVRRAVLMVHSGKADIVMKGAVHSAEILKAVLDKNIGLRTGRTLSHVAVFEANGYDRLMIMTDAGMNIMPTFQQKVDMVKNAVCTARALKIEMPKVAVISGIELVNPDMPSTVDAALLSKMNERGQIKNCIIDGPLSLDLALSRESARAKGVASPVAGQADILVLANIDAANVFYKGLVYLSQAKITGIVMGASAPVILTSRADSHEAKLVSVAISVLLTSEVPSSPQGNKDETAEETVAGLKVI